MSARNRPSAWVAGWTIFAAVWLWILGTFHFFAGLAGIVKDEVLVAVPGYILGFDLTVWGWVHLVLGVVIFLAGFFLFQGALWARITGITIAFISIATNFAWLPIQPVWSILMIAAGASVIWALTVHGGELTGRT